LKFNNIEELAIFEHQFWLQIFGDHSRFILNALSPKEVTFIEQANKFIKLFDSLLQKSRQPLSNQDLTTLTISAYNASLEIRDFKLNILRKHIADKINISMPPTFINHMINELDEYIFILTVLIKGKFPPTVPIHLHLLWLPDGSGHASTVANNLDATQKELILKGQDYSKEFDKLYLSAIEYAGFMRTCIYAFPSLSNFNNTASEVMFDFKRFLDKLMEYILSKKVIGTLTPLMSDHMSREECYYLTKLSMSSNTKEPECDPRKPRIET